MPSFDAADGTPLTYHVVGEGEPLICLPGGPMQSSGYLGDLGGLSAHRTLILLDLRGTGDSGTPDDPASYRCDRLVDDVEALRAHLGRDRVDVLGHSAGGSLAVRYAARHPDRIGRLTLVTPSPLVVGVDVTAADRRRIVEQRRTEPWFPEAYAAFERIWAGEVTPADWEGIVPFLHGRWDAAARAMHDRSAIDKNADAAATYYADGALEPAATRDRLAKLDAPVLLLAGEVDVSLPPPCAAIYAGLFPNAELAVQPGAGHYPWLDDPQWFVQAMADFLG